MSLRQRIVAIAESQVGYSTEPSNSYCNKFSAYWGAGTADCPSGETDEEWCADFAAWAWQKAGAHFTYGYGPGEINGAAVSFYEWGVANGEWHPATSGYVAAPGDVAVYGLSLGADPSAAHVAIVTRRPARPAGPGRGERGRRPDRLLRRRDRDRPGTGQRRSRRLHARRLREPALTRSQARAEARQPSGPAPTTAVRRRMTQPAAATKHENREPGRRTASRAHGHDDPGSKR